MEPIPASDTNPVVMRKSTDNGVTWTPSVGSNQDGDWIGFERLLPPNGNPQGQQSFHRRPAVVQLGATTVCATGGALTTNTNSARLYGYADTAIDGSGRMVFPYDCANPVEALPMPFGADPRSVVAQPAVSGLVTVSAADHAAPGRAGLGLNITRTYLSSDALTQRAAPFGGFGVGWHWTYSMHAIRHGDDSVTVVLGDGRRAFFRRSGIGSGWTPDLTVDARLEARPGGYVMTTRGQLRYSFDAGAAVNDPGRLVSITDRNDNVVTLTYTGTLLTHVTAPGGRGYTVDYSGTDRITQITLDAAPAGVYPLQYAYDASFMLKAVKSPVSPLESNLDTPADPAAEITRYTYDIRALLTSVRDPRGTIAATYTFGTQGRIASVESANPRPGDASNPGAQIITTTYPYQGYQGPYSVTFGNGVIIAGVTTTTEVRNHTTKLTNTANLQVQNRTFATCVGAGLACPGGTDGPTYTTTTLYTPNGDVASTTDPNGNTTSFTYVLAINGPWLNVETVITPAGTTAYEYNDPNAPTDPTKVTLPGGQVTTYLYNVKGNRTSATTLVNASPPEYATTTTDYNLATGEVTKVTEPTNRFTEYEYNTWGDRTRVKTPYPGGGPSGRAITETTYDMAGRATRVMPPFGNGTAAQFDGLGRVTRSETVTTAGTPPAPPLNKVTTTAYDKNGNKTSQTVENTVGGNAANQTTTWQYDNANRLWHMTDALAGVTTYSYNIAGQETLMVDARGKSWAKTYDSAGRRRSETNPLGHVQTREYDNTGNVLRLTKDVGTTSVVNKTIAYEYDSANRLRKTDLEYDGNAPTWDIVFDYNAAGQLSQSIGQAWQGIGQPTNPDIQQIKRTYTYDIGGRLRNEQTNYAMLGAFNNVLTVSYTYDLAGRLKTLTYPGGQVATYDYELERGLLTAVVGGFPGAVGVTYTFDQNGQRSTLTYTGTGLSSTNYSYDLDQQLTTITHYQRPAGGGTMTASSITYSYDRAGNRLTMLDDSGLTSYGYDLLNRLTSEARPGQTTSWGYDAVGNRTTRNGAAVWTYNDANQLVTDASGPTTFTFTYDHAGRQVSKVGGATNLSFAYDTLDRLLQDSAGTNVYDAEGLRVCRGYTGTGTICNALDVWATVLGQRQVLSDGGGTYLWTGELVAQIPAAGPQYTQTDALGSVRRSVNASGVTVGTATYDAWGQRLAGSTTFTFGYTGQRQDPSGLVYLRARYLDPQTGRFLSRDPIGARGYLYVGNNPTGYADPSGKCRVEIGWRQANVLPLSVHFGLRFVEDDGSGVWRYWEGRAQNGPFQALNGNGGILEMNLDKHPSNDDFDGNGWRDASYGRYEGIACESLESTIMSAKHCAYYHRAMYNLYDSDNPLTSNTAVSYLLFHLRLPTPADPIAHYWGIGGGIRRSALGVPYWGGGFPRADVGWNSRIDPCMGPWSPLPARGDRE